MSKTCNCIEYKFNWKVHDFCCPFVHREEEIYRASSLSYSYSYSYDSASKKDVPSHATTDLENEPKDFIDAETVTESKSLESSSNITAPVESDDDIENISLTTKTEEEEADETITLLKSEAIASDDNNVGSTLLATVMVGVGCAALVALLSFGKWQRWFDIWMKIDLLFSKIMY